MKVEFTTLSTARTADTVPPPLALEQSWKLEPIMLSCVGRADDPAMYTAPFGALVCKLEKLHHDTFADVAPSTCTIPSIL